MQLKPQQLAAHLSKPLLPVYLVAGDEPLTVLECAQQIRETARSQGAEERLVFDVDKKFDWDSLAAGSENLSLFGSRRLLDVRLPTGKPGREGGAALREFAAQCQPDGDLMLITSGKIEKQSRNSAWFKALDKVGCIVQCWPLAPDQLPGWLDERFRSRGVAADPGASRALAGRIEGNLLAAAQEVDKLVLLWSGQKEALTAADVETLVADSARFDVFNLMDSALAGGAERALRIAGSLRREDAPLPVVSWAITREVRLLYQLRRALDRGENMQPILRTNNVWDARRALLQSAMRRLSLSALGELLSGCARLDRQIKGQSDGEPWMTVSDLLVVIASGRQLLRQG